jgi:hypothetical protein
LPITPRLQQLTVQQQQYRSYSLYNQMHSSTSSSSSSWWQLQSGRASTGWARALAHSHFSTVSHPLAMSVRGRWSHDLWTVRKLLVCMFVTETHIIVSSGTILLLLLKSGLMSSCAPCH